MTLNDRIAEARRRAAECPRTPTPWPPGRTQAPPPSIPAVLDALDRVAPHLDAAVAAHLDTRPDPDAARDLHTRLVRLRGLIDEGCLRVSAYRVMTDPPTGEESR